MQASQETINILGFETTTMDRTALLQRLQTWIREKKESRHLLALNAIKVCRANDDAALAGHIRRAGLVYPDGFGVAWAMRRIVKRPFDNIPGCELMLDLMAVASEHKYRVFLLGGSKDVNARSVEIFKERYAGAVLVGAQDGFLRDTAHRNDVIEEIVRLAPDILLVAMGTPVQENLIEDVIALAGARQTTIPLCMGLGGSLDVLTGKVDRAPRWFIKMRLEWFYRFLRQPLYRAKTTLLIPRFVVRFLITQYFGSPKPTGAEILRTNL